MTVNFETKCNIRNEFTIKVEDIKTGQVDTYKAYNLVLDQMWTRLVNFQTYFVNIHYGTGTGTLAATRTSLFTHRGTKAATTEGTPVRAHPTSSWTRRIVLNPEEEVGQTITEVGVAFGATSTNLVTHAFLQDAEGNPISLLKTDTMVVTIYATVYFQLGAIDSMYGGKWRFVQPLANNGLLSYLMGATYPTQQFRVTRAPAFSDGTAPASHGMSANILVADWIKDAANKRVTTPVRRLGTAVGNGEIRGFGLGSSNVLGTFRGQFPITGVFTGKAITGENLGSGDGAKRGFNLAWNDPQSLVVKSNGVAVNAADYDVLPVKKDSNLMSFKQIDVTAGTAISNIDTLLQDSIDNQVAITTNHVFQIDIGEVLGAIKAYKFRLRRGDSASNIRFDVYGTNNPDYSGLEHLGQTGSVAAEATTEFTFTPTAYRYFRITVAIAQGNVRYIQLLSSDDQILFHTPPASGTITADYTVPYVPKDSNHVLDLQCAIQYGEITE